MANLKSPLRNKLQTKLADFLTQVFSVDTCPKLLLAYSGGLDSTVLLHLLSQLRDSLPFQLSAMHVHHGLSPNADVWAEHCSLSCQQYHVPFILSHVKLDKQSGLGIEAAARNARYQALHSQSADFICLAHHQDDQAETLLLQLARGAGVKGLSAMADNAEKLLRPLLDESRASLLEYAQQYQLQWIEDESNSDTRYDRNFMRLQVLPLLESQYPAIKKTLSRSARHAAEASQLLEELAQIDAQTAIVNSADSALTKLDLTLLASLSEARAKNLVRWWLTTQQTNLPQFLMPSSEVLEQILVQLLKTQADAKVKVKVGSDVYVQKYLDFAYLVTERAEIPPYNILWQGESEIVISDQVRLTFKQQLGIGLSLKKLEHVKLRIKNREGGERFKPDLGRPSRTIKRMLQEYNIPPWQRERLPLVFMDETLIAIPNLAVAANLKAASDEMGLLVQCAMD
jgi:tRNA(Ile)-lysidine synthase